MILVGSVAGGAAAALRRAASVLDAATEPDTPVNFTVPAGACDCHTHVIGDPKRFPFWSGRVYTPEPGTAEQSRAVHRTLRIDRIIIVHPSFYGTDNSCTLDGLRQLGPSSRAVAVIDDKTSGAQLDDLHRAGVRGIRLNFSTFRQTDGAVARQRFQTAVQQLGGRKWQIELFTQLSVIDSIQNEIMAAPVPVVIDHFGGAQAALGIGQAGFGTLLKLVQAGKAYVKVSAAYRASSRPNDYSDVTPLAKALIQANPQRILWGSDWPHPAGAALPGTSATDIAPNLTIDNGRLLNLLPVWAPDSALRKTILVDNPARLFGF
jgi:predicted TIM-barrel fold metal-dependent hydrolase